MRILFTNIRLAERSGTEIVVKDFALRLSELGHDVIVYSPAVGDLAVELTDQGVVVVDDLSKIVRQPDIIHGHHLPPTAEAILAFPRTPAIWVCHDATSWFDVLPRFSQVQRIFAVDDTCRARVVDSEGVSPEKVGLLPNAIDLRRVIPRTTPRPATPARALSLVKHGGLENLLAEASRQAGLAFEVYGHGVGQIIDNVEQRCGRADIVFATARTALEAMASGAAVIIIDGRGFGGMVNTGNFDEGRRLNFGLGMLRPQPTLSQLLDAIAAYDASDAEIVGERVRKEANLDDTIGHLEKIYQSVIVEAANKPFDADCFRREQIEFIRKWTMNLESAGIWSAERASYLARDTELTAQIDALSTKYAELQTQLREQNMTIENLEAQIARSERSKAVRLAKFMRRSLGKIFIN